MKRRRSSSKEEEWEGEENEEVEQFNGVKGV